MSEERRRPRVNISDLEAWHLIQEYGVSQFNVETVRIIHPNHVLVSADLPGGITLFGKLWADKSSTQWRLELP